MVTEHTILTKTLRDGSTATVTVTADPATGAYVTARRGTQVIGTHAGAHHAPANPGHVAAIGRLQLTQDEANQVSTAFEAFRASRPRDLHAERAALLDSLNAAAQARWDVLAHDWDNFDGGGNPSRRVEACTVLIRDRARALAVFDAEHPEVLAEVVEAERADVSRWVAQ